MNKHQIHELSKFFDQLTGLLESGHFPGKKAQRVLEALNYIRLSKEELHAHKKALDKDPSAVAPFNEPTATTSTEEAQTGTSSDV